MTINDIMCICNNLHVQSDIKVYNTNFPHKLIFEGELHDFVTKYRDAFFHARLRNFNITGDGFHSATFYIYYEV